MPLFLGAPNLDETVKGAVSTFLFSADEHDDDDDDDDDDAKWGVGRRI